MMGQAAKSWLDKSFIRTLEKHGAEVFAVGGAVRDFFLGKVPKDMDILVTKMSIEDIIKYLEPLGKIDLVGKSFGVLKFTPTGSTEQIDIALPRTERKKSRGHRGFEVVADANLPIETDLLRRDFTINAIAINTKGKIIDPYRGRYDLAKGHIRAVNATTFLEDPLRMLRAVQFAARFSFRIPRSTRELIKGNASLINEISGERILIELEKIALKGDKLYASDLLNDLNLYKALTGDEIRLPGRELCLIKANTLAEFMVGMFSNAEELYVNKFKGKNSVAKEIKALSILLDCNNTEPVWHVKRKIFAAYRIAPIVVAETSSILPIHIKEAIQLMNENNEPFSINSLALTGDELLDLGFKGPAIGQIQHLLLKAIYRGLTTNEPNRLKEYILSEQPTITTIEKIHKHISDE